MKKLLLPILLFVMFMPFVVNAKEYCKVVSGNGKDIGSEIACGTEHFYIIESNEDEIKMLAKYNLYTGVTIYKEKIEKDSGDNRTDQQYCQDLAISKGGILKTEGVYGLPGYCFIEINIQTNEMKQNDSAISAHWDVNNNYLYPQVGDIYLRKESVYNPGEGIIDYSDFSHNYNPQNYYAVRIDDSDSNVVYPYDFIIVNTGNISHILQSYKNTFIANNYEINDISLITLNEINNIVKTNEKSIPYSEWFTDAVKRVNYFGEFAFFNNYLSEKQSFIYLTTYWIRTGYTHYTGHSSDEYALFVDSRGGLCETSFKTNGTVIICGSTQYNYISKLGAGVRPVITVPNKLQYLIKAETDKIGTIDVVENSIGGETIQFKVSGNKGYKLGSIIIRTDSGEEVELSEGEIIKNDDGTFSIDNNKFTMPFENVTIQAKWVSDSIINVPDTLKKIMTIDEVFIIFLFMILIIGIRTIIYKRKRI